MQSEKPFLPETLRKVIDIYFSKGNELFIIQMMDECRKFLIDKKTQCQCDLVTRCCYICIFQFLDFCDKMIVYNLKMFAFKASSKYKYKYHIACSLISFSGLNCCADLDVSNKHTKEFFKEHMKNYHSKDHLYSPFSFYFMNHPDNIYLNNFPRIRTLKLSMGLYYFGVRANIGTTVSEDIRRQLKVFIEHELKSRDLIKEDKELLDLFKKIEKLLSRQTKNIDSFSEIIREWFYVFVNDHCKTFVQVNIKEINH